MKLHVPRSLSEQSMLEGARQVGRHVVMFHDIKAILTPPQQSMPLLAHVVPTGRSAQQFKCHLPFHLNRWVSLQVCMVYSSGELTLVQYGQNEVLGVCRTEHMSSYLISVCANAAR